MKRNIGKLCAQMKQNLQLDWLMNSNGNFLREFEFGEVGII